MIRRIVFNTFADQLDSDAPRVAQIQKLRHFLLLETSSRNFDIEIRMPRRVQKFLKRQHICTSELWDTSSMGLIGEQKQIPVLHF